VGEFDITIDRNKKIDARKEAPTNQPPDQWGQLLGKACRTHLTYHIDIYSLFFS